MCAGHLALRLLGVTGIFGVHSFCLRLIDRIVPLVIDIIGGVGTRLGFDYTIRQRRSLDGQRLRLNFLAVLVGLTLDGRTACHTVVQHMTDVALVAIELKQECEMLQFHVGVLSKHAVAIQLLVHDVREEALRNQRDLQIALIAGVVIHDIVGDIVRIERLDLAVGIHRQADCTGDADIGLPEIVKRNYGGKGMMVTDYTMSEIVASVYDCMENTGRKEGILFIDEINCVSETLAPMMLQFLQGKTFGNQKVPEGWVIVTAGNPPEYNKSVREFDVVTLDRIKKIDVEADFDVWKEYAYQQGIHPAVISYLELRRKNFYRVENTVDGKIFATARGWEDLSRLIQVYEILGKTVDREVVSQYIQHRMIAKDFASYLALYYKYRTDYKVEDILKGKWDSITLGKIRTASLDEHLSIVSLLNGKLSELFTECYLTDAYLTKLYDYMVYFREAQDSLTAKNLMEKAEADLEKDKKSELLTKQQERIQKRVVSFFENASGLESASESTGSDKTGSGSEPAGGRSAAAESEVLSSNRNYEFVKALFESETEAYENRTDEISFTLQNVFDFMEAAFGDSQEMVAFITELNANYYSLWFIRENGSDQYYRHNKGLLFDDRQKMLLGQMEEVENILNNGIK